MGNGAKTEGADAHDAEPAEGARPSRSRRVIRRVVPAPVRRVIRTRWRRRAHGYDDELSFWRAWVETQGLTWPEDYRNRLDPMTPLRPDIAAYLDGNRVLDAGAGPLTILGKTVSGRAIDLVPVDALADRYNELLDEFGVTPPVRTIQGVSEKLGRQFPAGTFDLAYACNTLDHSRDPVAAVRQMALVTRPGGYLILEHHDNEAEYEHYWGLHQWNLAVVDGRLIVSKRSAEPIDLGAVLSSMLETVEAHQGEDRQTRSAQSLHTVVFRRL
jgi:SAM-dependent methyltransferase